MRKRHVPKKPEVAKRKGREIAVLLDMTGHPRLIKKTEKALYRLAGPIAETFNRDFVGAQIFETEVKVEVTPTAAEAFRVIFQITEISAEDAEREAEGIARALCNACVAEGIRLSDGIVEVVTAGIYSYANDLERRR